jgi:replicative DNA helicase
MNSFENKIATAILCKLTQPEQLTPRAIEKIKHQVNFDHEELNVLKNRMIEFIELGFNNLISVLKIEKNKTDIDQNLILLIDAVLESDINEFEIEYLLNNQFAIQTRNKMESLIKDIDSFGGLSKEEHHKKLFELKSEILKADEILFETKESNPGNILEELLNNGIEHTGFIKTGIEELDTEINGFRKGELTVLGSRPAMGKTSIMLNIARNMAYNSGIPCAFICTDQNNESITKRLLQIITSLKLNEIAPNGYKEIWGKTPLIKDCIEKLKQTPLFFNGGGSTQIENIVSQIHSLVRKHKVEVIFIDNLQMISSVKAGRGSREQEISYVTRLLKKLSLELNICIVCSSQLSRAVETRGGSRRPHLSDLRESGAIEQDADKVLFLYRPEYYGLTEDEDGDSTEGKLELIVAKNKTGAITDIKLHFDIKTGRLGKFTPKNADSFSTFDFEKIFNNKTNNNKGDNAPF